MKVRMFTDGACSGNPGAGGWAACVLLKNCNKTVSGGEEMTTNNRMELKAVIEGLKKALEDVNFSKIEICSDSAYVVNSYIKGWIEVWSKNGWITKDGNDVKNKDLWLELNALVKQARQCGVCVQFVKVKGHAGNHFNELVDKLAREEVERIK